MKTIALIPAFDPGAVVTDVVKRTLSYVDAVILVNDGCDAENKARLNTIANAHDAVAIFEHAVNKGKGHAIMSGLNYALNNGFERIVMLDSDGQHDPAEIQNLMTYADEHDSDFVMGVRSEINKMPLKSKLGNVTMAFIFKLLYRQKLADTQSGFRLLSAGFARQVLAKVEAGRYETEMKMLMFAVKAAVRIDQVPIKTTYIDDNKNSKFRPINDSLRVISSLFVYAGVGFVSFLLDYGIYLLITYVMGSSFLAAHVISRSISAWFNYYANKRFVFNHSGSVVSTAGKYLMAVLFSLFLSSCILYFLVDFAGLNRALAKPTAEFCTFLINFFVLERFVFRK